MVFPSIDESKSTKIWSQKVLGVNTPNTAARVHRIPDPPIFSSTTQLAYVINKSDLCAGPA
jgi:hypothetical protein